MDQPALRSSDADREHTVDLLRRHSVEGRLTLEEFAQRVGAAYEAKTRQELEELTQDLPAEASAVPAPRRRPSRWIVSVMGGADRRGRFRLAGQTNVVTIMGGANIDLRQAELEESEAALTVVSVMGGANVVVPEGVDVELTGFALMGGRAHRPGKEPLPPGAPLVRVRAFSFMGGVSVVTKRDVR
jgi:uncharacterized protein DUF1707/cell wall-active antibiotic response 4TMS protein YvqF